jgi:hypothetical protein
MNMVRGVVLGFVEGGRGGEKKKKINTNKCKKKKKKGKKKDNLEMVLITMT